MESNPSENIPPSVTVDSTWKTIELERENEIRFEVDSDQTVSFKLMEGEAEFFGSEMAQLVEYTMSGIKGAIFSYTGANIQFNGKLQYYVASDTPMITYLNVHNALEDQRERAVTSGEDGPRVMLVGPTDSGKSTLSRILMNYATRRGHSPIFVDLDVGQGSVTLPAMLAAISVDKPIPIGQSTYTDSPPLAYFFGYTSPEQNVKLFKMQIANIAKAVDRKFANTPKSRTSGIIVNTCGWVDGLGYELIVNAIEALKIDVVLVIDHDRLFNDLRNTHKSNPKPIRIHKLAKSGGVVVRNSNYRKNARTQRIKEYFYGSNGEFFPHTISVAFSEVSIYKVGGGPQAPQSALPIGTVSTVDPVRIMEATPTSEIIHSIVGVSHAKSADKILDSNLAGYVYITDVNLHSQRITFLSPCPGALPSRYLVIAALKWLE